MNNSYHILMYINDESKIHKMSSKMKIACFLLSLLISIIAIDYVSVLLYLAFLYFIMFKSNIKLGYYLYSLFIIWPIYIIIFVFTYMFSFSILLSGLVLLKFIILVLSFVILTATTSLSEIAWGFESLFEKLKKIGFPVSKLALKLAMLIKFVSTLFNQGKQIRKSMAYRGMPPGENKIKVAIKMFIPVFSLSYKLSNRTIAAMKLRFYGKSKKRTNYHDNKATKFDKLIVFINIVFIYLSISLGWLL